MVSLLEDRRRILLNTPHVEEVSDGIASFETDVPANLKKCVVDIEPVQDLHGYDKPWSGGNGKNLFQLNATAETKGGVTFTPNNNDGTFTINGTATGLLIFRLGTFDIKNGETYILNGSPVEASPNTVRIDVRNNEDGSSLYNAWSEHNRNGTYTATESVRLYVWARVATGYTANNLVFKPMIRLATETDPTFEPYSNICPILGRTEMKVERCGKNLLKLPTYDEFIANSIVGPTSYRCYPIQLKSNTTYYIQTSFIDEYEQNWYLLIAKDTTNMDWKSIIHMIAGSRDGSITTDSSGILYLNAYNPTKERWDALLPIVEVMISEGSEPTSYEPYTGETYNITFPSEAGTVYGGTLDMLSGVLTVNMAMIDLGDLTWGKAQGQTSSIVRFGAVINNPKTLDSSNKLPNIVCSTYETITANQGYLGTKDGVTIANSNGNLYINDSSKSDLSGANFKAVVSGIQLCYELANPVTYQLDPHTLKAIRGTNNIWSDTGDTTVRFWTH